MLSFDHIKQIKISLMSINKAYFALRWGWQRCMVWLSLCLVTLSSTAACLGDAKPCAMGGLGGDRGVDGGGAGVFCECDGAG